jgi:hypothetical protein
VTAEELVESVKCAGGVLELQSSDVKCWVPRAAVHLADELLGHKPEVVALLRISGGRVAAFPHCPSCKSFALYRADDQGTYECLTCGLQQIEECWATRLV